MLLQRFATFLSVIISFLSAFLLFQIQPLIGNVLLPYFGGSSNLWSITLLFFQAFYLIGFVYSHLVITRFNPYIQVIAQVVLICYINFIIDIIPDHSNEITKYTTIDGITYYLLTLLSLSVGIPYLILTTTTPFIQTWYVNLFQKEPYHLYAISNLGSVAGLISYPFLLQKFLGLSMQASIWVLGFRVLSVLTVTYSLIYLYHHHKYNTLVNKPIVASTEKVSVTSVLLWVLYSSLASATLVASSNIICIYTVVSPFMWIIPLSLYLCGMICCFGFPKLYNRGLFSLLLIILACISVYAVNNPITEENALRVAAIINLANFVMGIVCHGELNRRRPDKSQITAFYLALALGGVVGGSLVSIGSPLLFNDVYEYYLCMFCGFVLSTVLFIMAIEKYISPKKDSSRNIRQYFGMIITLLAVAFGIFMYWTNENYGLTIIKKLRDFYGVIKVAIMEPGDKLRECMVLIHGGTIHGLQPTNPQFALFPYTYYYRKSGIGITINYPRAKLGNVKSGIIGLGCGTLASYTKAGDQMHFYEISKLVYDMATNDFSYLSNAQGKFQHVIGDARVSLNSIESQQYDLLVIDAFSGDAVPTHLLTLEAMSVYESHIKSDGLIAFHISNNLVDLADPVAALAEAKGMKVILIETPEDPGKLHFKAKWMVCTRDEEFFKYIAELHAGTIYKSPWKSPWTDDNVNIMNVIR